MSIWIVMSRHWPRAYLRAELIERGFEAIGYADLETVISALQDSHVKKPGVIIIDLYKQLSDIKILKGLMHEHIAVILLLGSLQENSTLVTQYRWAAVMKRPLSIGAIADKAQEITAGRN
ncbi:MAG TPA: hypothetical protein VHO84_06565 [Syntrophorhabdaceae bacterium]|nr:hypothetical protein [Syntrophorhabdaceae bacterium]